jgi:hypothetical protein
LRPIFFSDFVELASLVIETWRRNVRENQLLLCGGDSSGYYKVRKGIDSFWRPGA